MAELHVVPCTISDAKEFIAQRHRHHRAPQGGLFALAAATRLELAQARGAADVSVVCWTLCAVAIVGRPVARALNDGWTAEVTRLATDGTKNACSLLYGAAWRACRALGYRKLITYTLATEPGTSLRAAGWRCVGETKAEGWSRPSRPRVDKHPTQAKLRWEAPSV